MSNVQPPEFVRVGIQLLAGLARITASWSGRHLLGPRNRAPAREWRHNRGSFHTVQLDLAQREAPQAGEGEPASDEPRGVRSKTDHGRSSLRRSGWLSSEDGRPPCLDLAREI
jgi:hypothetical protein